MSRAYGASVYTKHDLPRDMDALGINALRILAFLWDCQKRGEMPSNQKLTKVIGCASKQGVRSHLLRLKRLGLVDWEYDPARGQHQAYGTLRPTCRFLFPSAADLLAHVNREKP